MDAPSASRLDTDRRPIDHISCSFLDLWSANRSPRRRSFLPRKAARGAFSRASKLQLDKDFGAFERGKGDYLLRAGRLGKRPQPRSAKKVCRTRTFLLKDICYRMTRNAMTNNDTAR